MKYVVSLVVIAILVAGGFWLTRNRADNTDNKGEKPVTAESDEVVLETTLGNITVHLHDEDAPKTAANFKKLVREKFYDGLTFHRVIAGFVIQGGDPAGNGTGGPGYTVPAEIKLLHKRGSIAMARTPDAVNPERASSGSQFYIALADLSQLDGQYTVFGEVEEGMDVVDKIGAVKTDGNDKPLQQAIIKKAYFK